MGKYGVVGYQGSIQLLVRWVCALHIGYEKGLH
jgi:hypothetical protein